MKNHLFGLLISCAWFPVLTQGAAAFLDLGPVVSEAAFWSLKPADAVAKFPKGALPDDPQGRALDRPALQLNASGGFNGLTLHGLLLDVKTNGVLRVSGSLVPAGYQATYSRTSAANLIKTTVEGLNTWAEGPGTRFPGATRSSNTRVEHHVWHKGELAVVFTATVSELEGKPAVGGAKPSGGGTNKQTLDRPFKMSSDKLLAPPRSSGARVEQKDDNTQVFASARLAILPLPAQPGLVNRQAILNRNRAFSVGRTVSPVPNAEGDVALAVVLPTQLPAGTTRSAVAIERVMRSSGIEFNDAELTELDPPPPPKKARTETGPLDAIKDTTMAMKVYHNVHIAVSRRMFEPTRHDYNVLAEKAKLPEIPVTLKDDVLRQLQLMNPALLRESRGKRHTEITAFRRVVQSYTGRGCPLLWVILEGKFPEENPAAKPGVACRIITGMNVLKGELLYINPTDPDSTPCRISFADAWCLTLQVISITPTP